MNESLPGSTSSEIEEPFSARNAALILAVALFAMVSAMYGLMFVESDNYRAIFFIASPILMVVFSLLSNYRPLIMATIAVCFMIGIVGMFSIGIPIFVMGICLLSWFLFKAESRPRKPFDWSELLIANVIVLPFMLYIASILLRL